MSCVNRNSKEFKFLAEHNNLSVNALELLTHKYWLENQTEDYFPSDVYIQAQLGKIPYEEPTKAVRELWGMKYKDPKEYQSLEELQEARKEALRFFPEEAVTYHTNFKGNYVLTIRKPMARLSLSMRDLTGRRSHDEQEQADFNLVVKALSKEQGKNITVDNAKEKLTSNPLKRQYRGKLIYAQSGTGKSTIADNIDVFDSDFLLGQVLGVSPETAGFFFKTLDSQQKTAFGEKYRELIRQKIAEGKTVLTANAFMLNEADVVMYNESAELTDKRVNADNRAINNRYSALDYHKDTLDQINKLRNNEKGKEYIKLDGDHYISDYLLTNPADINSKSLEGTDGTRSRGVEDQQTLINNFLSAFDITVNHLDSYNSKLPLFDALNRTINAQSPEEITEGVGYAIAFMMQSDPEMQKIIMQSHGLEGNYTTKVRDPRKAFRVRTSVGQMTRMLLHKEDVIKETGKQITEELRKHFGEDIDKVKTENKSIWNIIKSFFNKLNWVLFRNIAAKGNVSKASRLRQEALAKEGLFVADIVDALGRGDFSRIKGPMVKPGTMEKAQRVVIGKALKENPFEDGIIRKLGSKGISLAGSASIAVEGTLFRPLENPLHDIDFNAGDNSSRKTVDKAMGELFEEGTWAHSTSIVNPLNPKNSTQTYVLLNVPFTTKNVRDKGFYAEYYSPDGKYLGKRVKSELYLENGVQGKLLDFFVGPKAASKHGTHFEDFNGHRYLFSNSNAAMAAKILWARPKDMWDYKNFRREREAQDNFDELQMSVSSPQTFTFKDGTTVKAPFKPNYQQVDALNAMDEFIKSNRTSMTLSGYAGTGKTSLMEMLAEKMNKQYRPIMFCASTNKAAAVLKERVSKAGFDASTLNKIFGITVEVDPNKSYNARNLVNKLKDPKIPAGTTVVIDEASMINEENYEILNSIAEKNHLKIIYVGDAAQLAPVNETKISKVFRDQGHEIRTLSIVERTGDNAILKEATDLRDGKALSGESSFNSKGQGVAYLKPSSTQEREAVIRRFIPELKNNPNYFRILAYTNAAVAAYNTKVRQLLGYNDNIPRIGEPITGYTNWGYVRNRDGSSSYKFINSEAYKVVAVQQPKTVTKDLPKVGKVSLQVIPITLENSLGERRDYNLIDVKGNQENRATAFRLAKAKAELHNTANKLGGRAQTPYRQAANAIEEFLFVNDTLGEKVNGKEVAYQTKVFDFGYAMTVHKSQGSTFTHVLMDDVDINRAKDERNSGIGVEDVAVDWEDAANEEPVNYEVAGPMEDVDMGDWEDETPSTEGTLIQEAPKAENPDAANIRQQLKYVAVSRATDTVTIVSDNVKKEDTPLNHINEAPVSEAPVSENKSVEQMSSKEVWRYLSALQPTTKRAQVEYTPKGQARQTYTVENGHIYNSKGTEVYPGKTVHKNMVLANYAVQEGLAVVVKHPTSGEKYVVDNNQQITSVRTGKIMEWGEENGDRRKILAQAEKEFRERITATKERGSALNEQMLDQLQLIGLDLHYEDEMGQYLKEHGINSLQEFIGKKARAQFEQSLKKARPDMSEAEIKSTLDFLHSLEDSKENTAYIKTAIRWVANKSLTLPQDHTKAYQAFELARKKHLDLQKYDTLGELITAPEMQPKRRGKKDFDPDKATTFTNKKTVTTKGGRVFTVYDVENTEEGQREVCKALAAHYEMSPWCLSTFTATGEPTQSAKNYWDLYKALPRKIAFENGKPVAFNSDKYGKGVAETLFRGTPIITSGEESIIDSTERGKLSRGTIDAWKQEGLVVESKILPNALRLTEKAKKEIYNTTGEAWWDMEDTHPQDSLSDSIVADPNKQPILEEMREDDPDMAEYLYQEHLQQEQQALDDMMEAWGRMTPEEREQEEENWEEINLPWFLTPEGEVRGFATPEGSLYFDRTVMSPEHGIHEYTHLWDRVVAKNNPELWHRGVALMKQISLWKDIENDENYGKKWKALKGVNSKKLESLIASEVHSRLTGVNGEQILDRLSKEKGQKGIIGRLKQWLLDFWKDLKGTFSNWSQEDLDKLTLQDFTMMTIRDFADGFNPNTFQQAPAEQQSINERIANATQKHQGNWSRQEAQNNPRILYVFTDNTDRDSGSGKIPDDSWYSKKYGEGHHFPTMTAAVVRGLDNTRPISTQRWYHQGAKGTTGRWTDANVEEFKNVIRAELQDIVEEFNTGKYDTIMFPDGDGLFNTSISNITKARTPKLYQALADLLHEYGFDSLIPAGVKPSQNSQQPAQFEYARYANGKPNYEVSSKGDKRFSAMTATFAPGTTLFGHDVSGRTIESVYQHGVKQGDWTTDNNSKTGAPKDKTIITGNTENDSYTQGYLPLWQEWARQNPQLIEELRQKAQGKVITDMFASTAVSQARALADILNNPQQTQLQQQPVEELVDTSSIFNNPASSEVTVEDKMKPWRNDPSKQNISRRIYLKNHKDKGYFEVVKDFEDGYYSVHFKPTDSDNPNAFSKEEKETLFQAVADTIPVDGKLSTWGELSRGGIAGLERFSKLGFAQSGERTVTMKDTGEEVTIPVFTKYPETTQKISLPNYEDFIGATDETLVDAAWKVPYLQRLDAQLAEENPDIIKQMQSLLEATSEEEWVNQSDSKAKEQVAKTLDEYDKLIAQLNNLLDSNLISASEVRHTAELVVNAISDNITQLQKEKGLAEQQFPTLKSKLDFQTASRKDIIKAVGIDRLVYRAKLLFDPEVNEYEDLDTIEQADLIIENWDAIMTLASDIFAMNEGIGISRDFDNGGWQSTEGHKIDFDNFNDYENDPDAMAEETKDEQEHWQIEQRTVDILNSMSAMVRLALHECYQIDKEGNVIKSKWGIPERVNSRKAVNSILRWTQGALSLEDMIVKLSAKQAQQPWLGQLLERLNDKSGRETDFQSQFYGVFAKHFQLYSIVLEEGAKPEDRKYKVMHVNSHPALTEAMQTITTQFKVGEHPLFTPKGINKTLLGNNDTTGPKATFNLHKALAELLVINDSLQHGEDLTAETAEKATKNVVAVCKTLGYPVTEELVAEIINNDSIADFTKYLGFMVNNLDKAAKAGKADYDPFAYNKENSIGGTLRNFLTPITDLLEDSATNAFYDSGKMYQSYVTPSFMTKLLQKFNLEGEAFEDFLDSEYGNSEWFKFRGRNGAWRNEWLRLLATNEEARKIFDHKVELNFNKHNYMRNMTDAEYTLSLFAEYFAEHAEDKQEMVPAWFRIPMQSNKPSSEFIKFYSYRGANYKKNIIDGLHSIFLQELSRIQTVRMRNRAKNDPDFIKNFDKNGRQFNFLPFLNSYLENTAAAKKERTLLDTAEENNELATLLQNRIEGVRELSSEEEARLDTLVDKALYNHTDRRAQDILARWDHEGIVEAAKRIEGMSKDTEEVRNALENFLWNDTFAAKNILQLTVGDIAFYKDAEDLQKRLAQLHAPGTRGNVAATDYEGDRVSDGYYRTFILQDFDTFKSNIIANIAEVFDRKIARAPESQKAQLEALKSSLVRSPKTNSPDDKGGKYWNINVTDAQGYSSPSSYRKKAFIFGKWSHKAEDIYQKLLTDDYNYTDLETAFQPLKPFVYTHLEKHIGEGTPIETMKVPFQAKNSEYLLIMADALMQSEVRKSGELSRPNLLRAVYRVMEDSEKLNPKKGIDTVQFESAIKSGLQGKINIHQFAEDAGGENAAYDFMMSQIYQNYDPKKPIEKQKALQYNTDTFVHEAPFEDYCLQQEVPEHFKGHQQAHGSQIRMITPSDLDYYKMDSEGKEVVNYYEWTEPDGKKKRITADEFKKEYEKTIAANIEESINNLTNELHLNSLDKKERNIALSKILLREILSSPRYGIDLAQACAVDKATGEFRIPKGDPIQAKRIEQLINSIIKNRVNKQKIAGGPIVQVTNFGTSKQLHIRFKDNSGKILLTEEEFNNKLKGEAVRIIYKDYKEYLQKEQHGIAYFEVFIPIWANEVFEKFANEDGTIDVKAIEAVDPDLLKMISYRIPTEDKYSCAPMKVVGFMPREAGDAIMLPYELTEIDDSDFDVDKRYVMRKDIKIKENKDAIEKLLIQRVSENFAKAHNGKVNRKFIVDQVKMYMDNPDRMKSADKLMEAIHREKQIIMKLYKDKVYKSIKPKSGKTYRDNRIVDMTWAVLTNEMTADKILNPGGFDNFKKVGYAAAAYKLKEGSISWNELQNMSIDELNDLCYVDKDLTWADTQIQFYKQNAAAASLIGVFAVNKVAHATLEGDDLYLDIAEAIGSEQPFTIGSTVFGGRRNAEGKPLMTEKEYDEWIKTLPGFKKKDMSYDEYLALNEDMSMRNRMQVDPKYDNEGNLIGKTLGSGVSASADAAKTPVLNLLNINMTTVGTFTSLLRMGMPHEEACLFIGQDVIARVLDEFNRQNLTGYASLDSIITAHINHIKDVHGISNDADINSEPLTKEELVEGLTTKEHEVIDYKVLIAFQKAKALAGSIRKASFATRFNSISSAVGPLIIDNLIMEHKMEQFMDENEETHFYTKNNVPVDITDIFADHPVLKQFARTVDIARQMTSDMPAGSTGFRNLLKTLPEDIKEKIYNDKKLFSKLSDFYQSYLAIASGLINPANLKSYIDGFPKWFMKQEFKEKYPDNALIQNIEMSVSKKTGRAFLNIKLTGEDETLKETYRNAWIDLHKTNPELSQQLFEYCFFRAGIGFSPKTFMAVVPTYVKERLQRKLQNGETATYLDTYRRFPSIPNEVMLDQFIANNWEDKKLVPKKGGKESHFTIKGTELYATTQKDMADLAGLSYIKTVGKGETYLWKLVSADESGAHYTMLQPLGNNGEYLEMGLNRIESPMSKTTQAEENNDASEIKTTSPSEIDAAEQESKPLTTEDLKAKAIAALARDFMDYNEGTFGRKVSQNKANAQAEGMVEHPERYGSLMQAILKFKGIDMSKDDAIKKLKDLDLC